MEISHEKSHIKSPSLYPSIVFDKVLESESDITIPCSDYGEGRPGAHSDHKFGTTSYVQENKSHIFDRIEIVFYMNIQIEVARNIFDARH